MKHTVFRHWIIFHFRMSEHPFASLQWRQNEHNGVSNHQPRDCLYSTVYSGADQRKLQSSASLAFVRGIHRWPVNSPHKRPVTRKMFPFDDVIMCCQKKPMGHVNHLHALYVFFGNEIARKCLSMGDASRMRDITASELWWNWLWFPGTPFTNMG